MKMPVNLGKPEPWVMPVTFVCLALGALIAFMHVSSTAANDIDVSAARPEQLAMLYAQAKRENDMLQAEISKLRDERDKLIDGATDEQKQRAALQKEISDLRVRAGSTPVEGPGIVITLDDTNILKSAAADPNTTLKMVHDTDLQTLVNELRSAGAEAIAINDQRVVGSSAIRCVGPVINVNDVQVAAPFVVRAIGKTDTLNGAANLPNGALDWLRRMDIHVEVVKREKIYLPAVNILQPLRFGRPVTPRPDATAAQ